jgi:ribosomal protein S18 acetylase RimI-like enzyme
MAQASAATRAAPSALLIDQQLVGGTGRGPGIRVSLFTPSTGIARAVLHPTSTSSLPASMVLDAVRALRSSGHTGPITTPALSVSEVSPFEQAGFARITELALLRLELGRGFPILVSPLRSKANILGSNFSGSDFSIVTMPNKFGSPRSVQSEWIQAALDVDKAAFPAGEEFDELSIREALKATPKILLRFACRTGKPYRPSSVVGYAISGCAQRRCYLQRLAVHPSVKGKGLGAALCHDSMQWARHRRAAVLAVNTRTDNLRALDLYVRLGFAPINGGLVVMGLPTEDVNGS